ncbi:hypothetical protein T492DRAFT_1049491 [Pavlovales sp. CCMP2436]|nr:hypothetical protein T492DRAFT_1049491 [Pavlovales sp. CCMP2436]
MRSYLASALASDLLSASLLAATLAFLASSQSSVVAMKPAYVRDRLRSLCTVTSGSSASPVAEWATVGRRKCSLASTRACTAAAESLVSMLLALIVLAPWPIARPLGPASCGLATTLFCCVNRLTSQLAIGS